MSEKVGKAKEGLKNFKANLSHAAKNVKIGATLKNFSHNLKEKFGKPGSKQNTKVIALVVVGLVVVSLASALTGGWFMSSPLRADKISLEGQVTSLQTQVQAAEDEVGQYVSELQAKESEINSLKSQTSSLETTSSTLEDQIGTLQFDLDETSTELSTIQQSLNTCHSERGEYVETIRNSVKAVCCSFSDVQQNTVKNWDINFNNIVCGSGSLEVECGTGVTDNLE